MENLSSYETLFIVDTQEGDDEIKAIIDKFTSLIAQNGTIESINEWGRRKLAYPINDLVEGYYVLVEFKSAPAFPAELERVFGITDGIMRSIVVKHDEKKASAKTAPVDTTAPAAAPAEADEAPAESEAAQSEASQDASQGESQGE